jgi:hypothetical protein
MCLENTLTWFSINQSKEIFWPELLLFRPAAVLTATFLTLPWRHFDNFPWNFWRKANYQTFDSRRNFCIPLKVDAFPSELMNFLFSMQSLPVIMDRNRSLACREMIITCVAHMVRSHADKIRSGWKNIFSIFGMAAAEKEEHIIEQAFTTTAEIISQSTHFYRGKNFVE